MVAIVAYTSRSPLLAGRLWGFDHKGQSWEKMYALDDVQEVSIPYWPLNHLVDGDAGPARGFTVLDEARSAPAVAWLFPMDEMVELEVADAGYQDSFQDRLISSFLTGFRRRWRHRDALEEHEIWHTSASLAGETRSATGAGDPTPQATDTALLG